MKTGDLAGPILRSVSRSFYLTIRILPASIREPIGLAYLLARASDTIADSADVPPAERRDDLTRLKAAVEQGGRDGLAGIQSRIRSSHAGENTLMAELDRCLGWLESLGEFDRTQIRAVLAKIIRGQDLDLARFSDTDRTIALRADDELEEYTYLVAGCVGEFWTDVCLHHLPRYSSLPEQRLRALGAEYGKALQLVNILRDLPADFISGRCYLPADETTLALWSLKPSAARESYSKWVHRAAELLESGRQYVRSLNPARLRVGCYLPWELGRETLSLLSEQFPLETGAKVKVTRGAVRSALLKGLIAAFSNRPLTAPILSYP
ncbi:MAG TPA: squalene/phytoene synthase family protein [Chthoniobacteraceae bacterium]|nr:squalene/phytoene synthase family protein [Chthoniobacteraceae bacterium]